MDAVVNEPVEEHIVTHWQQLMRLVMHLPFNWMRWGMDSVALISDRYEKYLRIGDKHLD